MSPFTIAPMGPMFHPSRKWADCRYLITLAASWAWVVATKARPMTAAALPAAASRVARLNQMESFMGGSLLR